MKIFAALLLLATPAFATDDIARLHALFDRQWETRLRENPLFATSVGRHEYDDRLPSVTPADLARRSEQTKATLVNVNSFARVMGPALESLRPAFRQLNVANHQVLPFVKEAAPITKNQIRPFVRAARPYVRNLKPAAQDLATAMPDLTSSFHELNRFFDIGA